MHPEDLKQALIETARTLFRRGYAFGTAGNISCRTEGTLFCTPTRSSLGELRLQGISVCDLEAKAKSGPKPLKELPSMSRRRNVKRRFQNAGSEGSHGRKESCAGFPLCAAMGDPALPVVLKSGNFGGQDFFQQAIDAIRARPCAPEKVRSR